MRHVHISGKHLSLYRVMVSRPAIRRVSALVETRLGVHSIARRSGQTKEMMHKIDTDGDRTVSHEEYISYQSAVFDRMDVLKAGVIGPREFLDKGSHESR